MKRFNCLVALGANNGTINPHHEVPKRNISRAEVIVLRSIHGKDAVFNIVPVAGEYELTVPIGLDESGKEQFKNYVPDDMEIYRHLAMEYSNAKLIESLFNVRLTDLADGLDDLAEGLGGDDDAPDVVGRRTLPTPGAVDDAPELDIPPPGSGRQERRPVMA